MCQFRNKVFIVSFIWLVFVSYNQISPQSLTNSDREEILKVLESQRSCWNDGNLAGYMEGYWKSDSLRFIGKSGINYGWNATYETYKRAYPTKEKMGFLTFEVKSIESLSSSVAFMIGKWDLKRREDSLSGYFTLIWKKNKGKWIVTTDHSS